LPAGGALRPRLDSARGRFAFLRVQRVMVEARDPLLRRHLQTAMQVFISERNFSRYMLKSRR
jgi:hypothetical protein